MKSLGDKEETCRLRSIRPCSLEQGGMGGSGSVADSAVLISGDIFGDMFGDIFGGGGRVVSV